MLIVARFCLVLTDFFIDVIVDLTEFFEEFVLVMSPELYLPRHALSVIDGDKYDQH